MRILIIEDEPASAQRLKKLAEETDPELRVEDVLDSISSAVEWFRNHTEPDLVLCDIHLADGLSFEIFREVDVQCPIIFTTAYDQYAIQAFKLNSVDYLLKPIKKTELAEALRKFRRTRQAAPVFDLAKLAGLLERPEKTYFTRFVIRIGPNIKVIQTVDIAYFHIEEKIVFATTFKNEHYPMDQSLDELEKGLDPDRFFRINRAFLISFESIDRMIAYSKARIKIHLRPACKEESISSTERSAPFREWLKGR